MEIKFDVSDLDIKYTRPETRIINDSINYIVAVFNFEGEIWSNPTAEKTIIFGSNDSAYSVLLDKGRCYIPFEVLKSTGFSVGVMGVYYENGIEKTVYTRPCMVRTNCSCFADSFDNGLTPTQYEQLMKLISGGITTIIYEAETEELQISSSRDIVSFDEKDEALMIGA